MCLPAQIGRRFDGQPQARPSTFVTALREQGLHPPRGQKAGSSPASSALQLCSRPTFCAVAEKNQHQEHHKLQGDSCAPRSSSPAPGIRSAHGLRVNSRHAGSCWWDGVAGGTHRFRTSAGESKHSGGHAAAQLSTRPLTTAPHRSAPHRRSGGGETNCINSDTSARLSLLGRP